VWEIQPKLYFRQPLCWLDTAALEYNIDYIRLQYCFTEQLDGEATEEMQLFFWSSLMCKILSYIFNSHWLFLFLYSKFPQA